MGKRIFCDKCMQMSICSPIGIYPKKSNNWKATCGCYFKEKELNKIEVKTKYYTEKHGDLTNNQKKVSTIWTYSKSHKQTKK